MYSVPKSRGNHDELMTDIVEATNYQNAISVADLRANDAVQVDLQRGLRAMNIGYLRKRESLGEAKAKHKRVFDYYISKEQLAYAIVACDADPHVVRAGKESIWEGPLYKRTFGSGSLNVKLVKWQTMRIARDHATIGQSERTYMKWLITHFLWRHLISPAMTPPRARAFAETYRSQRTDAKRARLIASKACELAFKDAVEFFRRTSQAGEDANNFMRKANRHTQFEKFWARGGSSRRRKFNALKPKFAEALDAIVAES